MIGFVSALMAISTLADASERLSGDRDDFFSAEVVHYRGRFPLNGWLNSMAINNRNWHA